MKYSVNLKDSIMSEHEVRIFDLDDEHSIIVIMHESNYYGFRNICPHQSRKMGKVEFCGNDEIRCEHHGMKFNLVTGENTYSAGYFDIPSLQTVQVVFYGDSLHITIEG